MAELKGTNVAAGIVPFTDLDKYPTHYAKYGKGGYMSVETLEERDKIPAERKEEGMICYVITDPSNSHTYQLKNGKWEIVNIGASGIPIYDKEELDKLGNSASSKHIYVTTPEDLNGEVVNNTYTTSQNGTYLDILFSTIKQLQVEVARMRNAFKYGMYSYTGSETAMSNVVGEIEEPEEEPLWAVEPDMLYLITGADVVISENFNNLKPSYQVGYNKADFLELTGTVKWWDNEDLVKGVEDSKLFIYLTTSNLNISFKLQSLSDTEKTLYIPLEQYTQDVLRLNKYNVLVIISRKSDTLGGKNFVWVSIGNPETNTTLKEGYYDMDSYKINDYIKEVDSNYYPTEIELSNMCLYQLDVYSKYQEFTHDVLPSKPNDQDYKYRVAHITIRSVKDTTELDSIRTQLPNNELIFEEATGRLWIKNNNKLVTIVGSGGNSGGEEDDDSDMTDQQLIEKLKELGIVYETTTDGESSLQLSSISDVTFIHQATGKQFKFEVNAEGSLVSSEIPSLTLDKRIASLSKTQYAIDETNQIRGFVAKLHCSENNTSPISTKDVKLNSDRVKIGAVYMPLATDTVFGCSHAFVELENTSDKDFPLNGCYLHFLHPDNSNNTKVEHLALEGILPAGSTFLIRGKKYSDASTSSSTFISVDSYDMEWYVGSELIDFSVRRNGTTKMPYGFALTYGQPELSHETALRIDNQDTSTNSKAPNIHPYFYIDSLPIDAHTSTNKLWGPNVAEAKSNTIIKNMFELDPAKQAFQALNTYDSSRSRLANITNDTQFLNLDKATISFPHSEEEFPISNYTPKSSKEKKNVSTDKTKLDMEKPNAVNCSFGINIYTTRCFNWVSAGEFNEYVWIKDGQGWKKFESYKNISEKQNEADSCPKRKEFDVEINNTIYARLIGNFPGCGIHYTSHKCIIDVVAAAVSTKTVYTYVVGRADKTGNAPDPAHCSEEHTFTLYPKSYTPRVYQTTDQQGFHWIEYQVWSAAAKQVANRINSEATAENIIPVLINTGDMTQNGTRVNEWLDYFNGGAPLLKKYEHMAVVGNNDLCGPNPEVLGTGDDSGKSNAFYFHVFFCYEVFSFDRTSTIGKIVTPIINGKYVPSLYYFDSENYRFIMGNSELTFATCKDWFDITAGTNRIYNAYTGHGVVNEESDSWTGYSDSFVSVYTMMWNMMNTAGSKKIIAACHEMPFTVITTECIANGTKDKSRSISGTSLVGCHMNQISPLDKKKGIYWFSRLCEHFKVRLVLGGHKHTYAATLPVREYYLYGNDGSYNSLTNGPMVMPETLKDDDAVWEKDGAHLSKFPLLLNYNETASIPSGYFGPFTKEEISGTDKYKDNRVIYFMCQATGYKQTSNKELPTNYQSFSSLIPKSNITIEGGKVTGSKPDNAQKYPMYLILSLGTSNWDIKLARISGIQTTSNYKFTQADYSTDNMVDQFASAIVDSKQCSWSNNSETIINISI